MAKTALLASAIADVVSVMFSPKLFSAKAD
jgi:hypothetical protein